MKTRYILFLFLCAISSLSAQVGIGTTTPDASSILDITASDKGILVPRVSLADVTDTVIDGTNTAATGLLIYNTNVSVTGGSGVGFYYFNGTVWVSINSGSNVERINDLIDGKSDNDGTDNGSSIFLGIGAGLNDDETNNYNIGVGFQSLMNNANTVYNTSIGYQSLQNLTVGGWNTAIGGANLVNLTNGTTNTAVGCGTLFNLSSGSENVTLGFQSFNQAINASGNVGIGYQAGYFETGSNKLYIDNSNTATPLIYGDFSINHFRVNGTARITDLAGTGTRMVIADANGDLSTQTIPANGDINGVTAGSGLIGGGTAGNVTISANANNGLNVDAAADAIQLGGALTEDTTITQGNFDINYNLTGTGDFAIHDSGVSHFQVSDIGTTFFGGDTFWRDESTSGTNLAVLLDDGNDGRFIIYENGLTTIDLDGNTGIIFNEQGLDRDFRVESDNQSNMFFVDASTDRVGIGTGAPQKTLHVVGDVLLTGGVRNIEIQGGDQNIQLDDANPTWNGNAYGGVTRFYGDGVLANSKLEAGGLELQRHIQIQGGNPAVGRVLTSDAVGNATWQDPNTLITADNGLNIDGVSNSVQLGGALTENTVINQETYSLNINLNSTGDFFIHDSGVPHFQVNDAGSILFGGDTYWRDENTAGTNLAILLDDGNDGRFLVYENGSASIDLDANSQFIFNEQGLDRDFRVESDNRQYALMVDAGNDLVRVGTGAGSITGDGTVVGGVTADFVADFDVGLATGTAIGIGSIEFIVDGSSETLINNAFSPTTHLNRDLGNSTATSAWDDVFADNFVNVSDLREKENINEISYGLKEILQMRPVSYVLKQDPFKESKLGLIAQEALQLVPESVKTHDYKILDESKPDSYTKIQLDRMGMTYNSLIPVIIKATQEQQEIIEKQNSKIDQLEKEINQLKEFILEFKKNK